MAVRPIDANELLKKFACSPADTEDEQIFNAAARKIIRDLPTLTPPNEPLTLEQLREMDGEPVWVEFEDGSGGLWGIVHITIFAQIVFANGLHCTIGERYYGKSYKAYRRPPEGEEDT